MTLADLSLAIPLAVICVLGSAFCSGTACLLQSACSQFTQCVTAGWPHGCFFSRPVSTVQVSIAPP